MSAQRAEKEQKQVRGDNLVVQLKLRGWLVVWSAALVVMGCGFGPDARGETETADTDQVGVAVIEGEESDAEEPPTMTQVVALQFTLFSSFRGTRFTSSWAVLG